jgi:cytochrome c5
MTHLKVALIAAVPFVVSLWSGARAASAQAPESQSRSVWEGVYTTAQATRGQEQYDVFCTGCHGSDMQGGTDTPALVDTRFTKKWDRRTLKDLFELISQQMPENRPGTLSKDVYAEILSYILQGNGLPPGAAALPSQSDQLARIVFEETNPNSR